MTSLDHNMLVLYSDHTLDVRKLTFSFDSRWTNKEGYSVIVERAWKLLVSGLLLFSIHERIKNVTLGLIRWNSSLKNNSAKEILKEITDYFQNLFQTSNPDVNSCILEGILGNITPEMNQILVLHDGSD
ncbi:transducin/WD40 repeat-like superfamily protein [Striga asiatica]|uniref:Transducin/WD40 repeat-like superfamily protein n=1 Tax=Striga asiatica TaxID=4170 RepID=A0A5A7PTU0_STRAF|nr:transducin/WD40 repeat-like superfamily protein [Striga asiatica]